MRSILFDTRVLIDVLRDEAAAVQYVRAHVETGMISATTRAEVLAGVDEAADSEAVQQASALLDALPCLPVTRAVADRGARLARTEGWRLPMALQVAVALENSLTLATPTPGALDPDRHDVVTVPYTLDPAD